MTEFSAPRGDDELGLIRMQGRFELRAADGDDMRTLVGYAAKFNEDTTIDSWEGRFTERIAPGAFKRSIKNNGDQIKVLFNHGMDPSIGDKPLGRASVLKEDKVGLYVEVPLARTSYNADLIELLDVGALDGMSFRFSVVKDTWDEPTRKGGDPIRTLNEVRLYEFGPVTFPAYQATTAGIRSREAFDAWRSLSEEKRAAIFNILGTSFAEPATSTSDEERAGTNETDPDTTVHSARAHFLQWQARARLSPTRKDAA